MNPIDTLNLSLNDLDFVYSPTIAHTVVPDSITYRIVVDSSAFFSNNGGHMVFSLDTEASTDPLNPHKPHCGAVLRRGKDMWSTGRGFIIHADGSIRTEEWNGTFSPDVITVTNSSGTGYNPSVNPVITIQFTCHYGTSGTTIQIWGGIKASGTSNPLLFEGSAVTPAKTWTGRSRPALGAIGQNFVKPSDTGCVEQLIPQQSPNARVMYTGWYTQTMLGGNVISTSIAR